MSKDAIVSLSVHCTKDCSYPPKYCRTIALSNSVPSLSMSTCHSKRQAQKGVAFQVVIQHASADFDRAYLAEPLHVRKALCPVSGQIVQPIYAISIKFCPEAPPTRNRKCT